MYTVRNGDARMLTQAHSAPRELRSPLTCVIGMALATGILVPTPADAIANPGFPSPSINLIELGDVDADGHTDYLRPSMALRVGPGLLRPAVEIVDGQNGRAVHVLAGIDSTSTDFFGLTYTAMFDIDGDMRNDVAVGAPLARRGQGLGAVYLFSGATGELLHIIESPEPASTFGVRVNTQRSPGAQGVPYLAVGSHVRDGNGNIWEKTTLFRPDLTTEDALVVPPRLVDILGDLDCDRLLTLADLTTLVEAALIGNTNINPAVPYLPHDLNDDGFVDFLDVELAIDNFFDAPWSVDLPHEFNESWLPPIRALVRLLCECSWRIRQLGFEQDPTFVLPGGDSPIGPGDIDSPFNPYWHLQWRLWPFEWHWMFFHPGWRTSLGLNFRCDDDGLPLLPPGEEPGTEEPGTEERPRRCPATMEVEVDPTTHYNTDSLRILPADDEWITIITTEPAADCEQWARWDWLVRDTPVFYIRVLDPAIACITFDRDDTTNCEPYIRVSSACRTLNNFRVVGRTAGETRIGVSASPTGPLCKSFPVFVGGTVVVEYDRPALYETRGWPGFIGNDRETPDRPAGSRAVGDSGLNYGSPPIATRPYGAIGGRSPICRRLANALPARELRQDYDRRWSGYLQDAGTQARVTVRLFDALGDPKPGRLVVISSARGLFTAHPSRAIGEPLEDWPDYWPSSSSSGTYPMDHWSEWGISAFDQDNSSNSGFAPQGSATFSLYAIPDRVQAEFSSRGLDVHENALPPDTLIIGYGSGALNPRRIERARPYDPYRTTGGIASIVDVDASQLPESQIFRGNRLAFHGPMSPLAGNVPPDDWAPIMQVPLPVMNVVQYELLKYHLQDVPVTIDAGVARNRNRGSPGFTIPGNYRDPSPLVRPSLGEGPGRDGLLPEWLPQTALFAPADGEFAALVLPSLTSFDRPLSMAGGQLKYPALVRAGLQDSGVLTDLVFARTPVENRWALRYIESQDLTVGDAESFRWGEQVVTVGAISAQFMMAFIPGYDIVDVVAEGFWEPVINGDPTTQGYAVAVAAFLGLAADAGYLTGGLPGVVLNAVTSTTKVLLKYTPPKALSAIAAILRSGDDIYVGATVLIRHVGLHAKKWQDAAAEHLSFLEKLEAFKDAGVKTVTGLVRRFDLIERRLTDIGNRDLTTILKSAKEFELSLLTRLFRDDNVALRDLRKHLSPKAVEGLAVVGLHSGRFADDATRASALETISKEVHRQVLGAAGGVPGRELVSSIDDVFSTLRLEKTLQAHPPGSASATQSYAREVVERIDDAVSTARRGSDKPLGPGIPDGWFGPHTVTKAEFEIYRFMPLDEMPPRVSAGMRTIARDAWQLRSANGIVKVKPYSPSALESIIGTPASPKQNWPRGYVASADDINSEMSHDALIKKLRLDYRGSPHSASTDYLILRSPPTGPPQDKVGVALPREYGGRQREGHIYEYPGNSTAFTTTRDAGMTPVVEGVVAAENFRYAEGTILEQRNSSGGFVKRWRVINVLEDGVPTGAVRWEQF